LTPAALGAATVAAAVAPVAVEERQSVLTEAPPSEPVSSLMPALAWSETDDHSRAMPVGAGQAPNHGGGSGYTSARPALNFQQPVQPRREKKESVIPWYRLPALFIIGTAVAVLLVGIALAIGLSDKKPAPAPGVNTTPASAPPANGGTPQPAPPSQAPITGQAETPAAPPPQPADAPAAPAPAPVDAPPPAAVDTPVPAAPPPPAVEAPAPPPVPQIPAPAPRGPAIPPIPGIPPIPRIPGISLPIPGFGGP
jgi:hypothetical protein